MVVEIEMGVVKIVETRSIETCFLRGLPYANISLTRSYILFISFGLHLFPPLWIFLHWKIEINIAFLDNKKRFVVF